MNSQQFQIPINPDEQIQFQIENIPFQLQSNQTETTLNLSQGCLSITNQRILFTNKENYLFQLDFLNIISHGIQDQSLVCYLNGGENNNDEEEEEIDTTEE